MKYIVILFFNAFIVSVTAQNYHNDSINTNHIINGLSDKINENPKKAKSLIHQLKHFSNFSKSEFYYWYYTAHFHFVNHELDSSFLAYKKSYDIAVKKHFKQEELQALNWLGNHYYFKNKREKAKETFQTIVIKSKQNNNVNSLLDGYQGLSMLEKDNSKALQLLLKVDSVAKHHNIKSAVVANNYYNIAKTYTESLANLTEGIYYYEKGIKASKEVNYSSGILYGYKKLGEIALKQKQLSKAKTYFQKLYNHAIASDNIMEKAHANFSLALVAIEETNYTIAIQQLQSAIAVFITKKDDTSLAYARVTLAETYLKQSHINKAKTQFQFLKNNTINDNNFILQYQKALVNYYNKIGDFKNAFIHQKKLSLIQEKIVKEANHKNFLQLENQYKAKERAQEIELLSKEYKLVKGEKKIQQTYFILLATILLIASTTFFLAYKNKQKVSKKLKELDTTKNRLFANISHEFKTPLTLINSPVQLLKSKQSLQNNPELLLIEDNVQRLTSLVNQLLEIAKIQAKTKELRLVQGNLISLIHSQVKAFDYLAKHKNIQLTTSFSKSSLYAWYDTDVVQKIISNLISNAVKHGIANSKIILNTQIENKQFKFTISNTTKGLAEKDIPKFFERFYSKHANEKNTGIGLALVKELVNFLNGTINITLKDDLLTVTVIFPIKEAHPDNNSLSIEKTIPSPLFLEKKQKLSILLIDDHNNVVTILSSLFKKNFNILTASNGEEGLQIAQKELPNIIITDVMMPKMDGFTFCKKIKETQFTATIPIVILTAKSTDNNYIKALQLHADAFIAKPFNHELLQQQVYTLLEKEERLKEKYQSTSYKHFEKISVNLADKEFLVRLKKVLEKDLVSPDFSAEVFATNMHLSRMQLHRKLKQKTGLSTTEFIKQERLKIAHNLLLKEENTIAEIAYNVGFNSTAYFTKEFKKHYQQTPSAHRKKNMLQ